MGSASQVVFAISAEHSGSTWVGYVLGSSKKSAFLGEYYRLWHDGLRVPCTLCAGRELESCVALHDAQTQPPEAAYAFASRRLEGKLLVDTSKDLGWVGQFVKDPATQASLVIVVRDPRGWIASVRRRRQNALAEFIDYWVKKHNELMDFAERSNVSSLVVCYDLLASSPQRYFKQLFSFCGLEFEPASLAYWNYDHHAIAANGASDALIKRASLKAPAHFHPGDKQYYAQHSQTNFHDQRWKETLPLSEQMAIEGDPAVLSVLARMELRLTAEGIEPSGSPSSLGSIRSVSS
ncbi:sulfotransferase [Lichenicoccus sp.]|uniref:sulfotransferase n=1 Tax=Lichenicoccus sp. TaxID=2781899 RepID=UPI003D0DD3A7